MTVVSVNSTGWSRRIKGGAQVAVSEGENNLREEFVTAILSRYHCLGRHGRHAILLAFDYTKGKLELESGDFGKWSIEEKMQVAQKLLQVAEELFKCDFDLACGAGLLSFYLEAQTSPEERARRLLSIIRSWYFDAVDSEFNTLSKRRLF